MLFGGKFTPNEQIGRLDKRALFRQFFNRVAAVAQYALITIDERYVALARTGISIALIQRDVSRLRAQFRNVNGLLAFRAHDNGQLNAFAVNLQFRYIGHDLFSLSSVVASTEAASR